MKETGEKAEEHINWAKEGYEIPKNKAGETFEKAKESVASNLESAKEKVEGQKRDEEFITDIFEESEPQILVNRM
ncbi:hypothetical protein H5410_063700 [Solanum commersonii]|uniref:Uncharacterized protein n=1 Tax=Solanum commersonii TaxID=4109 RepID=A0A9J5WGF9_SOLCO|nr:hypothetical protein H5410_063700 [Solanum commersonii]